MIKAYTPIEYPLPEGLRLDQNNGGYKKGCKCPTCHQNILLKPKVIGKMLYQILKFINQHKTVKSDIFKHASKSAYCNWSSLKYWDLIVIDKGENGEKFVSLSRVGKAFVKNEIALPKRLYVFNDTVRKRPLEEQVEFVRFDIAAQDVIPVSRESVAEASYKISFDDGQESLL